MLLTGYLLLAVFIVIVVYYMATVAVVLCPFLVLFVDAFFFKGKHAKNVLFVSHLFEKFPEVDNNKNVTNSDSKANNSSSMSSGLTSISESDEGPSVVGVNGSTGGSKQDGEQQDELMQLIEENLGEQREEKGASECTFVYTCARCACAWCGRAVCA